MSGVESLVGLTESSFLASVRSTRASLRAVAPRWRRRCTPEVRPLWMTALIYDLRWCERCTQREESPTSRMVWIT